MSELLPHLSANLQAFIRSSYGVLMLLTLVWAWPNRRRFFLSERWGGYAESQPSVDWLHNPVALPLVLLVWAASCSGLIVGAWIVPAALVNLLLCRYNFVSMRWKGLLRGMGAPGFMAYWLGAVVLLLEYTRRHAPHLQGLALLVAQVDVALIMLSAGVYKATAGYARNEGMDFGMANPEWGYWWRVCRRFPPGHWALAWLNHLAWGTEVVAAILMFVPQTRAIGGLLISVSFIFVGTQIRLGWLAEMMILCGLLFVPPGHLVDEWVRSHFAAPAVAPASGAVWLNTGLAVALIAYLALLPLAHAGLFYNFYARARFPKPLQALLERYTNFFGIIIWRVFSVDHLNFLIGIYQKQRVGGARTLVSRYGSWRCLRFSHVAESIVVTAVFTTLKYYASNRALFETRLARYARTLSCRSDSVLVFQYVAIRKSIGHYDHVPTVEYVFDPADQSIRVVAMEAGFDPGNPGDRSVVHEGAVPGSYAPAAR
jgi:hypothetical protein